MKTIAEIMADAVDLSHVTPEVLASLKASGIAELNTLANQLELETKSNVDKQLEKFISTYPEVKAMKERIRKLAPVSDPVLIQGESGTGKELVAKALHGDRKGKFNPINCASIPETLAESQLFGYVKGAFTDAKADTNGLFVNSKDGTVFLDEIGDLPLQLQGKLLRVIQEKKVRPLGGDKEFDVNCRVVCATHRDLYKMSLLEQFRFDLYMRLSTFELRLIPLRDRTLDIPPLIEFLDVEKRIKDVRLFCAGIDPSKDLAGNVRKLEQYVRRYYVLGEIPGERK